MSWATRDHYDVAGATWLQDRIIDVFSIQESTPDRFGLVGVGQADIRVDNTDNLVARMSSDLLSQSITVRHVIEFISAGGNVSSSAELARQLRIVSIEFEPGEATLRCEDSVDAALESLYPDGIWSADQWPNLYPDHEGSVIPEISGTGVGVSCVYLGEFENLDRSRWRYGACVIRPNQTLQVDKIYRADRLAATYDATDDNFKDNDGRVLATPITITIDGVDIYCLDFVLDQTQYAGGDPHPITAIVSSLDEDGAGRSRNAAREIRRLLLWAEIAVDETSFMAAEVYCNNERLWIDYAYREQRRLDALLDELLFIARASLVTAATGEVSIIQDTPVTIDSNTPSFNALAGDAVEIQSLIRRETPQAAELRYRPWFFNPESAVTNRDGYAGYLKREIRDGTGPVYRLTDLSMVREFEVADRIVSYWEGRLSLAETARARVEPPLINGAPKFLGIGDVISIADAGVYPNAKYWRITDVTTGANEQELELELYSDASYVYIPSDTKREPLALPVEGTPVPSLFAEYEEQLEVPYRKGSIIRDGRFLMSSNKQTEERPAPQFLGLPYKAIDDQATMEEVEITEDQDLRGIRLLPQPEPFLITRVSVYFPTGDDDQRYQLWAAQDVTGQLKRTQLATFDGFGPDGWNYLELGQMIVPANQTTDIYLIIRPGDVVPTQFAAEWQYERKNGTADEEKIWHRNNGQSQSINYVPKSGGNQQTNLQSLMAGDEVSAGGQLWTIQEILSTTGSNLEIEVSPATRISENEYQFTFTKYGDGTIRFVRILDYFVGSANFQGIRGDSYNQLIVTENAFGVNVEIQKLSPQDDWDFMALSA